MNLEQLINKLAQQGVTLRVQANRLVVQTTQGALDADMQAFLTDFEEEVVLWLAEQSSGARQQSLPPIVAAPAECHHPFPLTDIQHAYWVGRSGAFALGDVSTHGYFEVACQPLDLDRLNRAWQQVIARHEMLRAIVTPDGQQQILHEVPAWQITTYDLRGQAPTQVEAHLAAIRNELSHQVLPADRWPLFDLRATQLDQGETRLHLSLDVLFWDFASLLMILNEWQQYYEAPDCVLPTPTLSFRDYVLAAQQIETTDRYQQAKSYWCNRLDSLPPAPELPLAQEPAQIVQTRTQRRAARLDRPTWVRLQQRGQQQGLTANGVLLAAFAEVLTVWSKQPIFTLNLTLFNRLPLHPEVDAVVGDFTTINLLAVDNSQPAPFGERAQRLQKQLWADLDHQIFSGVQVLRELAHQRSATASGVQMPIIFTSGLGFDAGQGFHPFGKLVYGSSQTPQAWLDHIVIEEAGELAFHWDTVEALFPAGLLDDLFATYCDLLHRLADEPATWQMAHPVPLPQAQQMQRAAVNNTDAAISAEMLHTLFLKQVPQRANQPAVLTAQRSLTYGELYQRANQVGHWLRSQGVRPNCLVAVVMEKGWEQVVAVLGIHLAGAAYLPIDPSLPTERRHYLLQQGEVVLVLTQSSLIDQLIWPEELEVLAVDTLTPTPAFTPLPLVQQPTDLAYVIYTSGSTGQPKGVMIDHRGAVNTVLDINRRFGVTAQDRVLALSALNFDLSVYDIFGLLAVGGAIVLPDPDLRTDPAHWLDLMTQHGVTLWDTVPALMQMLVDTVESRQEDKKTRRQEEGAIGKLATRHSPLGTLRLVMLSGDWIPVTLPDRIKACWPGVTVYGLGGATEASIWSNYFLIEAVDRSWPSIPYGKPLTNQSFQVLDANLNPRPVWLPGDLYIGGIGLALGYWKDEAKTQSKFIIHPQSGERLYKTGDLGRYLPDGNLEFLGREDFQVKIRGHRIELGEIETALLQHPAIKEAVVTAVGNPKGNRHLAAYLVLDDKTDGTTESQENSLYDLVQSQVNNSDLRWQALLNAGEAQTHQLPVDYATFLHFAQQLEAASLVAICQTLRTLGFFTQAGQRLTLPQLMAQGQLHAKYEKLLLQWLQALCRAGFLQRDASGAFVALQPLPTEAIPAVDTTTADGHAAPWAAALLAYFQRSVQNHLALLRGAVDPLEIFFPNADLHTAESLYQANPLSDYYNQLVAAVLRAIAHQNRGDKALHVMEVGAGIGGTTASLLPHLPPQQTRYTFTDLSTFFTDYAKQKFAAYPFLEFGYFDIDQAPHLQGYPPHQVDVIMAANVLHNARNIHRTLQSVRSLLAPGGILLILATNNDSYFQMATVRFIEGFSHYEDERIELNSPILNFEQWQQALQRNGYEVVTRFPTTPVNSAIFGMNLVVAQTPAVALHFAPEKVRTFLANKLPDYMLPQHYIPLEALPLSTNGKVDRNALPAPDTQPIDQADQIAPTTATQIEIATIWSEVLKVPRIGIEADFFELGGDSLLATQALSRLRTTFQLELSLRDFLTKPTVADLAQQIDLLSKVQELRPTAPLLAGEEDETW